LKRAKGLQRATNVQAVKDSYEKNKLGRNDTVPDWITAIMGSKLEALF
jgi:hypothetical protein